MAEKKIYSIGILFFLIFFLIATVGRIMEEWVWVYFEPYFVCPYNLKVLWILSQKVSRRYQVPFPPPIKLVKVATRKLALLTEREANYLGRPEMAGNYYSFPLSLICPRDPKYLLKVAMDSQGLDYQSSYQWHPDARTLAYCPYCRIAVLLDGKIEKLQ